MEQTRAPSTAISSSGGDVSWSDPTDALVQDGNSATIQFFEGGQQGDGLGLSDFGFNLPPSAAIDGIIVTVVGSNIGTYGSVSLSSGDLIFQSKDTGDLNTSYGSDTDTWGLDDLTGADINVLGVGIGANDQSGGDGFASIDYVEATVYWSASAPEADVPTRQLYKVYSNQGTYLGNLPKVVSDLQFPQDINSVGSRLVVTCGISPDNQMSPIAAGDTGTWPEGWTYRKKITIPAENISDDLSAFPVYIDLSTLGSHFFANVNADGSDVRVFRAAYGVELPFEMVSINTTDRIGELWFRANLFTSDSNAFYIYYGNATATAYAATDPLGSRAVWSSWGGVYHLDTVNDSTANGNTGTAVNTPAESTGKVGGGYDFEFSSSQKITLTTNAALRPTTFPVVLSSWVKPESVTNSGAIYVSSDWASATANYAGLLLNINSVGEVAIEYGDNTGASSSDRRSWTSSATIDDNEWHHIVAVLTASTAARIFIDGEESATATSGTATSIANKATAATIGGRSNSPYFDGIIDEFRIRSTAVGGDYAAWTATEYANQVDPLSFYVVGLHEEQPVYAPIIKNGNRLVAFEYNRYYPNGKPMFRGQINRARASHGGSDGRSVDVVVLSDGVDMDNIIARGAPFSYTNDQSQATTNSNTIVSQDSKGVGWQRYGQTWTAGVGVTNLGAITLRVSASGGPTVTISVYSSTSVGTLLGSVTKSVKTPALATGTNVQFAFPNLIPVTAGQTYFFTVAVNSGQSIRIFHSTSNPYANGAMYSSAYGGGGGGQYEEISGRDMYFITQSGTATTNASYTSDDPTTDMLLPSLQDYNLRGGRITPGTIEATGLSLSMDFKVNTMYEFTNKVLDASPNGFYYAVDLGLSTIDVRRSAFSPDFVLVRGKHLNILDLDLSIEDIKNMLLFSGGDTGSGTNLYMQYQDADSMREYGQRLERKSDNRVTLSATADAIGKSFVAENKGEKQYTSLTIPASVMNISLLTPGKMLGFVGVNTLVDSLVARIVRREYFTSYAILQIGMLPPRQSPTIEKITRGLIAEQTIDNPSSPS